MYSRTYREGKYITVCKSTLQARSQRHTLHLITNTKKTIKNVCTPANLLATVKTSSWLRDSYDVRQGTKSGVRNSHIYLKHILFNLFLAELSEV
jgi:hypothetical protein